MRTIVPLAVFLLMMPVGMSLRHKQIIENLQRMSWTTWFGLLLATFIVPVPDWRCSSAASCRLPPPKWLDCFRRAPRRALR